MFQDNLNRMIQHIEGARACMLMGFDGILIASVFTDAVGDEDSVTALAIEVSGALGLIKRTPTLEEAGALKEISLLAGDVAVVARVVLDEYLLLMALDPDSDTSRGARALRLIAPWVEQQM